MEKKGKWGRRRKNKVRSGGEKLRRSGVYIGKKWGGWREIQI